MRFPSTVHLVIHIIIYFIKVTIYFTTDFSDSGFRRGYVFFFRFWKFISFWRNAERTWSIVDQYTVFCCCCTGFIDHINLENKIKSRLSIFSPQKISFLRFSIFVELHLYVLNDRIFLQVTASGTHSRTKIISKETRIRNKNNDTE